MSDDAGTVTVDTGAGQQEFELLTARAIKEAAATIASAVIARGDCFVIVSGSGIPPGDRLLEYDARRKLVNALFDRLSISDPKASADAQSQDALAAPTARDKDAAIRKGFAVSTLGELGRVPTVVSNAIGIFKSDYQIGGTDLTPKAGAYDSLLAAAVASALLAGRGSAKTPVVAFAASFGANRRRDALEQIESDLDAIARRAAHLESELETCGALLAKEEAVVASGDAAQAATALPEADRIRARCERLKSTAESVGAFFAWLASSDATSGTAILARVVAERSFELATQAYGDPATSKTSSDAEEKTHDARCRPAGRRRLAMLHVRTENAGGGYVTRKSLLSGLFSIPLSMSGGAAVSYALIDNAGDLIAADVVTVYGGLVRLDRLRDKLTGTPNRTLR